MADHLGGYVPGGDPATWFPDLWRWFVEVQGVRSVLDVGCGDGRAMDYFKSLGCEVRGVEGVLQERKDIYPHDYQDGPLTFRRRFDLVWSCEFVEHVEERYIPNFMATFAHGDLIAFTHAFPGQPGWHHVNCRGPEYWSRQMARYGFVHEPELSTVARRIAALNTFTWEDDRGLNVNHFMRSGQVYRPAS